MMRGTIHLLAAEDLAVWASASTTRPTWNKGFWKKNFGVEEKDIQAASDIVESVMSAEGMTRDAIADAVFAKVKNQAIDELLRAGWGSFLKIIAARGQLCFGVPEGRNVTFVRPDMWVKDWQSIDTDAALREVCRRYLGSHGPATREEFARWWGFAPARANQVLEELTGETVIVNREGDAAYVLKKDLKKLESSREDDEIRNLGLFDAYVLSGLPHDQIIPKFHKDKVLTTGAWVQRTVLRGGRVVGVWTVETKGKARRVELKPFKKGDVSKSEFSAALAPFVPFVGELTLV
jgi:hypothetical protein